MRPCGSFSQKFGKLQLAGDERRQNFARAGKRAAAVHRDEIIDEGDVAGLPGDVEGEVFGDLGGDVDGVPIKRRTVAEGDRFRGVVAGVLPALKGGDELVEEGFAAIAKVAYGGQYRSCG